MITVKRRLLRCRPEVGIVAVLLLSSMGIAGSAFLNPPPRSAANVGQFVGDCDSDVTPSEYQCLDAGICIEANPEWFEGSEEPPWLVDILTVAADTIMDVTVGTAQVVAYTAECGLEFAGNVVTGLCDFIGSIFRTSHRTE